MPSSNLATSSLSSVDQDMDRLHNGDDKKTHIHPGVKCHTCGTDPICGLRFKCSICEDYDECENCLKDVKTSHFASEEKHDYWALHSPFTYSICETKVCHKELRNVIYNCKTCSNDKIRFMYCDTCFSGQHQKHDVIKVNVLDFVKSNEHLLRELKLQRNAGKPKEIHMDIHKCRICNCNGVNYRGYTYRYTNVFLCEDCFAKGWGFYSIGFVKLSKEDALQIRQDLGRLKAYEMDQLSRLYSSFNNRLRSSDDYTFLQKLRMEGVEKLKY